MTARKHSGINATREVLKDQLALAADTIIALRNPWTARLSALLAFAAGLVVGVVL